MINISQSKPRSSGSDHHQDSASGDRYAWPRLIIMCFKSVELSVSRSSRVICTVCSSVCFQVSEGLFIFDFCSLS